MAASNSMMDPQIFQSLQQKIDEDVAIREALRDIVQTLEKQDRATQALLSQAHSTPTTSTSYQQLVRSIESSIQEQIHTVGELSSRGSKYPYYKYNGMWSRHMQDTTFSILFCGYLGGFPDAEASASSDQAGGRLLSIDAVGSLLHVPVNLKDRDEFHLTIEEYLHALISLVDELARLSRNAVTLGDYTRPMSISIFVKSLHAGFGVLNLKNDALRKRSDGIKYRVKEVEDVVYDLSLRGLVPKAGQA